ncbi:fibrillarin-like rRNA/tRNA 2'-O-methyltransferase [Bdellovibrio sp. 22V]|uniref:protein-L-isoaspartate O-methyltransferase family protein n=1 Tax=Bdellovibrio TaxID=958 RepID=UPI0025435E96|nr:methyltransferase domain-containing protein [Bdellovibrio sp. 22V]WII73646.1 fibrillarin-like rRNA/tRNA 2'-O-methyltransferase [Bdellovibrio sp. 22V]
MASQIELYQENVIKKALPLSEKVVEAFYHHPRHLFVPEYSIAEAYSDHPLLLFERSPLLSTISQPSFVLKILDMLQLESGHKVFELGTGSGWNTALMAHIVGDTGKVISVEVIPEMAKRATDMLKQFHVKNAVVLEGDGFEGYQIESPYDRAIFTAGSREFPEKLFEQLKEGGRMVFVRETHLGYDSLELIEKKNGVVDVISAVPCSFVSVIRKKESRLQDGTP